jgi:hypothetical protein
VKPCTVETCEEPVPNDRHMCRYHWFKTPLHLRNNVWAAYNRYNAAHRSRDREKLVKAAEALRKAQDAATAAVNAQILGKATT